MRIWDNWNNRLTQSDRDKVKLCLFLIGITVAALVCGIVG